MVENIDLNAVQSVAKDSLLDPGIRALPVTLIVGFLSAWLGKVWANRISSKESHLLSLSLERQKSEFIKEIENVKSALELETALVKRLQETASTDSTEVFREQIKIVQLFWNYWMSFRTEATKFLAPHQMLKVSEINSSFFKTKFFPYSPEEISKSISELLRIGAEIEKIRPLVPMQIYQHFIGVFTLYMRLAVKIMVQLPKSTIPVWHQDDSGGYDISVTALINYAKTENLSLPDPSIGGESWETFSKWKEILEEKLVQLIYQFVNGSLSRQINLHSSIRELVAKNTTILKESELRQ